MKNFNSLKLITSFREISDIFEIISSAIRIIAFVLVIFQGIMLIKETKKSDLK